MLQLCFETDWAAKSGRRHTHRWCLTVPVPLALMAPSSYFLNMYECMHACAYMCVCGCTWMFLKPCPMILFRRRRRDGLRKPATKAMLKPSSTLGRCHLIASRRPRYYKYIYIHTYLYACMDACMHVCMYVHVHTYTDICKRRGR